MLRNLSGRLCLTLSVLLLAGLTVLAPPAQATIPDEGSARASRELVQVDSGDEELGESVGTMAVAPACVHRFFEEHWYAFHVHGQNNCSGRRYVKVIIAFGPDSGCIGLDRGQSFTHSFQIGRFDRLDSC